MVPLTVSTFGRRVQYNAEYIKWTIIIYNIFLKWSTVKHNVNEYIFVNTINVSKL